MFWSCVGVFGLVAVVLALKNGFGPILVIMILQWCFDFTVILDLQRILLLP